MEYASGAQGNPVRVGGDVIKLFASDTKAFFMAAGGVIALTILVGLYIHLELRAEVAESRRNPRHRSSLVRVKQSPVPTAPGAAPRVTQEPSPPRPGIAPSAETAAPSAVRPNLPGSARSEEEHLRRLDALAAAGGAPDDDELAALYRGGSREVRKRCLEMATGSSIMHCRDWISEALMEPSLDLRRAAVQTLQTAPPECSWVDSLLQQHYSREADAETREMLVYALVSRTTPRSLSPLLATLWSTEQDMTVRRTIAAHLGTLAASDSADASRLLRTWQSGERDVELRSYLDQISSSLASNP